jgi:hypothetical protein
MKVTCKAMILDEMTQVMTANRKEETSKDQVLGTSVLEVGEMRMTHQGSLIKSRMVEGSKGETGVPGIKCQ